MLLTVDVGNSHTVLGLFEGPRLIYDFRIGTAKHRTTDELHVLLLNLLQVAEIGPQEVTASIIASVVPSLDGRLSNAISRAFEHETLIVGPGIKTGVPILYENPREVGADRVVNAVAAFEQVKGAVIVVDFGTATTFDCISPKGEYLGGVIAPGIEISANALFERAAKLPRVEVARPPRVMGRNTVHSMQSGIVYGYAGLVDGIVERLRAEMGGACPVLATGGLASLMESVSRHVDQVDELLTLNGLRLIYERNV